MLDKEPRLGLTYDDVVLVPAKSQILPSEVDMRTMLTRHIKINIPKFHANPELLYDIMAYELMYICYCDRSQRMSHGTRHQSILNLRGMNLRTSNLRVMNLRTSNLRIRGDQCCHGSIAESSTDNRAPACNSCSARDRGESGIRP